MTEDPPSLKLWRGKQRFLNSELGMWKSESWTKVQRAERKAYKKEKYMSNPPEVHRPPGADESRS